MTSAIANHQSEITVSPSFFLVEAPGDQVFHRRDRVGLVVSRGRDDDLRTLRGGQQKNSENTLSIDLLAVLPDLDRRLEAAGGLDEFGRGSSVEAEPVANRELPLDHGSGRRDHW